MATKPILAVALNATESAKLVEAVQADQSARSLAGEVGVLYVKRTGHKVWDSTTSLYDHFATAIQSVIMKAAPNYSNVRMLTKYARDSAQAWFVAEGDPELKAKRDAMDQAKADAKAYDARVAEAERQSKREDITVSEQKMAKAALAEVKAERGLAKATAQRVAGEYALAYESKFPTKVAVMSKEDKLSAFVKAVKTIKSTYDALEDGSVDKYVADATKAYLDKMVRWTEVKSDAK